MGVSTAFSLHLSVLDLCFCRGILAYNKIRSSLAEFTTVILAGCFPIMPRFLQVLHGRNKNSAYTNSHQTYSKPSVNKCGHLSSTNESNAPMSWGILDDMANRRSDYLPLEERAAHDTDRQDTDMIHFHRSRREISAKRTTTDPLNLPKDGITKTVHMETSFE